MEIKQLKEASTEHGEARPGQLWCLGRLLGQEIPSSVSLTLPQLRSLVPSYRSECLGLVSDLGSSQLSGILVLLRC